MRFVVANVLATVVIFAAGGASSPRAQAPIIPSGPRFQIAEVRGFTEIPARPDVALDIDCRPSLRGCDACGRRDSKPRLSVVIGALDRLASAFGTNADDARSDEVTANDAVSARDVYERRGRARPGRTRCRSSDREAGFTAPSTSASARRLRLGYPSDHRRLHRVRRQPPRGPTSARTTRARSRTRSASSRSTIPRATPRSRSRSDMATASFSSVRHRSRRSWLRIDRGTLYLETERAASSPASDEQLHARWWRTGVAIAASLRGGWEDGYRKALRLCDGRRKDRRHALHLRYRRDELPRRICHRLGGRRRAADRRADGSGTLGVRLLRARALSEAPGAERPARGGSTGAGAGATTKLPAARDVAAVRPRDKTDILLKHNS